MNWNKLPPTTKFELLSNEKGIHWRKEFRFHDKRKWRFDYCNTDAKVVVEIQGGSWVGGAHNRPVGMAKDYEKHNNAMLEDWTIFYLSSEMVTGEWVKIIKNYIEVRLKKGSK